MSVDSTGTEHIRRLYKKYPAVFQKEGRKTLINFGNKLENAARSDHEFNRQSGKLDTAISADVKRSGLSLKFWIDPEQVTSGKYNYGLIQHEGSYSNYRPSGIAKRYAKNPAQNGGGIEHDYFMLRPWERIIPGLKRELIKDMKSTVKRLGLK